jgi:hypothetical protein
MVSDFGVSAAAELIFRSTFAKTTPRHLLNRAVWQAM